MVATLPSKHFAKWQVLSRGRKAAIALQASYTITFSVMYSDALYQKYKFMQDTKVIYIDRSMCLFITYVYENNCSKSILKKVLLNCHYLPRNSKWEYGRVTKSNQLEVTWKDLYTPTQTVFLWDQMQVFSLSCPQNVLCRVLFI